MQLLNSYNIFSDIRNSLISNKLYQIRNEYNINFLKYPRDVLSRPKIEYYFRSKDYKLLNYLHYDEDKINDKLKLENKISNSIFNTNIMYRNKSEKECKLLEQFLDSNNIKYESKCVYNNDNDSELYIKTGYGALGLLYYKLV